MINKQGKTKPKEGESCNGCGYCCSIEPCLIAREFLSCESGPCVALEWQNGESSCGMTKNPLGYMFMASKQGIEPPNMNLGTAAAENLKIAEHIAEAVGIGRGCDSQDDHDSELWNKSI